MRVFILALDGLEYSLVVKWKLKYLLQKTYGKYKAPISPRYKKPHTPSAWMSFITGKPVEEHGIDAWWTWGKFLDWLRFKPPFVWIGGKRKILEKLGIKPRLYSQKDLKVKTLFDHVKPSIALNIPAYNEPTFYHDELSRALKRSLSEYEKIVWKVYEERKKRLYEKLDAEWKLFMVWFDLADLLGHIYIAKRPWRLMKAYLELNTLAKDLQRKMPENTIFLIVSDHGMKAIGGSGDHSLYGFYSINIETTWKPNSITDFYPKILEWLKT